MIGYGIVWGLLTVIIKALYAAFDSSIGWLPAILVALVITLGIGCVFVPLGFGGDDGGGDDW